MRVDRVLLIAAFVGLAVLGVTVAHYPSTTYLVDGMSRSPSCDSVADHIVGNPLRRVGLGNLDPGTQVSASAPGANDAPSMQSLRLDNRACGPAVESRESWSVALLVVLLAGLVVVLIVSMRRRRSALG